MEQPYYNYPNIIKLYETTNENGANRYLDVGWVLLSVALVDRGDPRVVSQYIKYVLGWDKTKGRVVEPASDINLPF